MLHHRTAYPLHRRVDDVEDADAEKLDAVIFGSYTIAFLAASALTVYLIAYFKPPCKWHWYCRLRGRPVEPSGPSSPSASPTTQTFVADDNVASAIEGRKRARGWTWRNIMETTRHALHRGERRNGSIPSHGIRLTAVYTVRHDPASPTTSTGKSGAEGRPRMDDSQEVAGSFSACSETKVYGGGKAPWTQEGGGANVRKAKMPPPAALRFPASCHTRDRTGSDPDIWSAGISRSPGMSAMGGSPPPRSKDRWHGP